MTKFTPQEKFCIEQLVKKGYQTRTIANILEHDVGDLHKYIKYLVETNPSAAPPRPKTNRTIPRYDDPRSAEIGSRLLLSALLKYFEKRKHRLP